MFPNIAGGKTFEGIEIPQILSALGATAEDRVSIFSAQIRPVEEMIVGILAAQRLRSEGMDLGDPTNILEGIEAAAEARRDILDRHDDLVDLLEEHNIARHDYLPLDPQMARQAQGALLEAYDDKLIGPQERRIVRSMLIQMGLKEPTRLERCREFIANVFKTEGNQRTPYKWY